MWKKSFFLPEYSVKAQKIALQELLFVVFNEIL